MKQTFFVIALCWTALAYGQYSNPDDRQGERYFEDQFYLGVTYNFLGNMPSGVSQENLSYGLQLGAFKDIPLNRSGTKALGIGMGMVLDTYYTNLLAVEGPSGIVYSLADEVDGFRRSKIETHSVEMPLEFRWRNSTATEYRFWRLYTGVKAAYIIGARSKSVIGSDKKGFSNDTIRRFQYGPSINFGYNTFNIHLYYALNNLFEEVATLEGAQIGFNSWKIGVMFYIL